LGNATDGFGRVSAAVERGSLLVNATINRTVPELTQIRFVVSVDNALTLPATAVYSVDDAGSWLRRDERIPLHRNTSFEAATLEFSGRRVRADPQPVETLKGSGLAWAALAFSAGAATAGARTALDVSFGIASPLMLDASSNRTIARRRVAVDAQIQWRYRPPTQIFGEFEITLPGFLDPRERADILKSGSDDSRDLDLSGRDAQYFVGRWGGCWSAIGSTRRRTRRT